MKNLFLILLLMIIPVSAELTLLGGDGATKNRIRMIIVGDGYTAAQKSTFLADAQKLCDGVKAETYFSQFSGAMNIYASFKASEQSGADHPLQGTLVNTAFDGTFGNTSSLERLVTCSSSKVVAHLKIELTNYDPNYDITLVLINDTQYGGSGGQIATTTKNGSGVPVAIHEVGHSFAKLTDEYDYQPEYSPAEKANSTAQTNRTLIKWAPWIEASTPIPTPETSAYSTKVGLFEGACYRTTGWYRPWNNCMMKDLNHFCPVCTEEFVFTSYKQISPIESTTPASGSTVNSSSVNSLSVTLLPLAQKPAVTWIINGTASSTTNATLNLASAGLKSGSNTVKAIVKDNSGMVKIPSHFSVVSDTATWTVNWSGGTIIPQYGLTVTATNGTVVKSPSANLYDSGSVVSLTASPNSGYIFDSWSGGVVGTTNPIEITMKKAESVTAIFKPVAVDSTHLVINQKTLTISSVSSEETANESTGAVNILDGDSSTFWHTEWTTAKYPHYVVINCGKVYGISGIEYTPRQDVANGRVKGYEIYVSRDTSSWGTAVKTGTFNDGTAKQAVLFSSTAGQYVKFVAVSSINGADFAGAAELNVLYDSRFNVKPVFALTITGGVGSGIYETGTVVDIAANTPEGKRFVKWVCSKSGVLTDSLEESTSVTIPAEPITVVAQFEDQVGILKGVHRSTAPVVLYGSQITVNREISHGIVRVVGFNGRILAEKVIATGQTIDLGGMDMPSGIYVVQVIGKEYRSIPLRFVLQ